MLPIPKFHGIQWEFERNVKNPSFIIGNSANFFLLDFDNCKRSAKYVAKNLEKKFIILRSMESYKMKNKLRMTIGSSNENKRFIKEMKIILK